MSELTREVRDAFRELDSIDIEEVCPGLTESEGFERYCRHLNETDGIALFLEGFVSALAVIANRTMDAPAMREQTDAISKGNADWNRAAELLREAEKLLNLPPRHYRVPERTPRLVFEPVHRAFAKLVGTRGKAADDIAATKAFYIRLIARNVPESFPNRFAFIADTANRLGLDYSRQGVRSLLLKGRT